jgi:hypothetical protein
MPAEVVEMYSKFYRNFRSDFDLDTDKNYSIGHQSKHIALGNMMTAALTGIDSCN